MAVAENIFVTAVVRISIQMIATIYRDIGATSVTSEKVALDEGRAIPKSYLLHISSVRAVDQLFDFLRQFGS